MKCKQNWKHNRMMMCLLKHSYCKFFYFTNKKIHWTWLSLYTTALYCLCVYVWVTYNVYANFAN